MGPRGLGLVTHSSTSFAPCPIIPLSPFVSKLRLLNMVATEQNLEAYLLGMLRISYELRTPLVTIFSSRYSETGMNCRIHAPKLPGFLLWMYTSPGPRKRQTNPSPDVTLAIQPEVAFSML